MSEPLPPPRSRTLRLAFGALALVSVVLGLLLYLFADSMGIDQDTAEIIAIAFLVAGAADALVLQYWDRLFTRRDP